MKLLHSVRATHLGQALAYPAQYGRDHDMFVDSGRAARVRELFAALVSETRRQSEAA